MEDFLRACQNAVLDSGAKALASDMGVPHVSLLQRANPDNDDHHLTVEHLHGIIRHTRDVRPLAALADEFGFRLVPYERPKAIPMMAALGSLSAERGDVIRLAFDAASDNQISQHERTRIEQEIQDVVDALQVLRESLKSA